MLNKMTAAAKSILPVKKKDELNHHHNHGAIKPTKPAGGGCKPEAFGKDELQFSKPQANDKPQANEKPQANDEGQVNEKLPQKPTFKGKGEGQDDVQATEKGLGGKPGLKDQLEEKHGKLFQPIGAEK